MNNKESSAFIPMVDLRTQYVSLKNEIQRELNDVLENTAFIFGPNVHAFEDEISTYLDVKHAISCASGTDALHLALRALDIQPGDEIITPSFTFAATAEAIRYVDAKPVFIDIDPLTLNLDPQHVEDAITDKTRAIIVVHLFGLPANMDGIRNAIKDKNIRIVEDCAQSFGASLNNKKTGALGDIACFSFFPSKNLGAYGDGGLISTQHGVLADKLKLLRNHGSPQRYQHEIIGYNSRLDEIQAAILRIKLKHIDEYNKKRHAAATYYTDAFKRLSLQTPHESDNSSHVYHQYTLLAANRDEIRKSLEDNNIASAIYYPSGLHQQLAFKDYTAKISLPVTELVATQCLSLPMYPELSSEQIDRVISAIQSAVN